MKLRIRRRWLWLSGVVAGLVVATALLSLSVDEPARRYMEREINSRLTGYTVSVRAAHVHPWTVSIELLDATISQMDLTARIERADMASMNDLARAYGGFNVAAGELSVYSELKVKDGAITGYVKPLFKDVKVGAAAEAEEPKTFGHWLYEGVVGLAAKILRNRPRGEVATVVTISGRVDQLQYSTWEIVGQLLQNAFFKAILPGFDPKRSPKTPPT